MIYDIVNRLTMKIYFSIPFLILTGWCSSCIYIVPEKKKPVKDSLVTIDTSKALAKDTRVASCKT
jgi:hypothetical protein